MLRPLLLAGFLLYAAAAGAATSPLWDGLPAGPHRVGFVSRWFTDPTRSWQTEAARAPGGRPVRVSIWYPAQAGGEPMHFRDYVRVRNGNTLDARFEGANMRLLERVIRGSSELERLLAAPVAARAGAAPLAHRFPIVVYASGWNEVWQHANFVLGEFLASHGFIVVTVPQLPTTDLDRTLGVDPMSMETQMRDLEFALAKVRERRDADATRVATMGHSMGGVAALLVAMRQPAVKAVIGLDASYGTTRFREFVKTSIEYRPRRFVAPLLDLRRASDEYASEVIDDLRYADRFLYRFNGVQHADFTSFPQVALHFATDIEGRTPAEASRAYVTSLKTILAFLDAKLDLRTQRFTPDAAGVAVELKPAERRPPDESEWARIIERDGVDRALSLVREHRADAAAIDETRLNSIGYWYLGERQFSTAIGIFHLNTEAHPTSANAADSLAEGYLKAGDDANAARAYRGVLDLAAGDPTLRPERRDELQRNAQQKLSELSAKPSH